MKIYFQYFFPIYRIKYPEVYEIAIEHIYSRFSNDNVYVCSYCYMTVY